MTVERGAGGNVTLSYVAKLDAGCHSYLFAFDDSTGDTFLLPGTGNYLAGTGCAADYASGAGSPDGGADGGVVPTGSGCSQAGAFTPFALLALLGLVFLGRRRAARSPRAG
jgi:hypothetical protein